MNGYFDRIENNLAVILVEKIKKQYAVPLSSLPPGSKPGMWFSLEIIEGKLENLKIDKELSTKKRERTELLMKKLQSRSGGSKFKRK